MSSDLTALANSLSTSVQAAVAAYNYRLAVDVIVEPKNYSSTGEVGKPDGEEEQ